MESSKINQKTVNATKWSTVTEIFARCAMPITNMILARLLTPEAFGVVATVTMVVSFADMFTDAGFQKYLIQHDFGNLEELDQNTNVAFWTNLVISVILWLGIWAFRDPLAEKIGNPGLGNVIAVASLSLPLTSFSGIQMARFQRDFDFKTLFFVRMIAVCVPFLVTIPMALLTRNYWALIIGTLMGNLANAIALTLCSSWKPQFFFRFRILKEMFSYSWWILLESVSNWLSSNIGVFVVSSFLSAYYLGLYKTSMSTVSQIMGLITAATSAPIFSALARLKENRLVLVETYCEFIHRLGILLFPLGVGIWLYRDFITVVLLGTKWVEAADFIGLWGLSSSVVLLFGTYCNGLYNAIGKTKLSFFSQLLHLVALIPALIWSAPHGFEALYKIRCAIRLELILVQFVFMKCFLKVPLLKLVSGLYPAGICTLMMLATALALQKLNAGYLWSIFSIGICMAVYFVASIVFFRKETQNAFALFGIQIK